jgi:hypothetical protein
MKSEIKFGDWLKFELLVAEVLEVGNKIKLDLGNKQVEVKGDYNVVVGDKIVIGLERDKIIVPLAGNSVIVPEEEIENGSRIG